MSQTQTPPVTVDVRETAPRDRHPRIFYAFDRLAPGETLLLVNDHDPKPLYYQFQAERPNQMAWSYLAQGIVPEVALEALHQALSLQAHDGSSHPPER